MKITSDQHRRTLSAGSALGPLGLASELTRSNSKSILGYDTPAVQSLYQLGPPLRKPAGSSVLRKAVHVTTEQVFVCKTVQKRNASSVELETVRQEVQIMQLLKKFPHPNVLNLIDAVEDDKSFHLISEALHGQSLLGLLGACGPYEEEDAKDIFVQAVRAVHHLHRLGIVHRGVTLDSFVFNNSLPERVLKLVSFSSAVRIDDVEPSKPYINHYYAAPEVWNGRHGKESDMFSLGVILYTMLAGYFPFSGASRLHTIDQIFTEDPSFDEAPWHDISPDVQQLISSLLSRDQSQRPSTETLLQNCWLPASKFRNLALSRAVFMELIASPKSQLKSTVAVKSLLTQLPAEQMHSLLSRIDELFEAFDPEHTGGLTIAQLEEGLQDYNISILQLHSVFKKLDMDQDGVVSYEEFLAGIMGPALLHSSFAAAAAAEAEQSTDSHQPDQNAAGGSQQEGTKGSKQAASPLRSNIAAKAIGDVQGSDQFRTKSQSTGNLLAVSGSQQ